MCVMFGAFTGLAYMYIACFPLYSNVIAATAFGQIRSYDDALHRVDIEITLVLYDVTKALVNCISFSHDVFVDYGPPASVPYVSHVFMCDAVNVFLAGIKAINYLFGE